LSLFKNIEMALIWKKLLIIGDSNTQFGFGESNWLSLLSNLLQRRCDVINRGFSGYNTRFMKNITPKILSEFTAESICGVLVLLGLNDSARHEQLHVPLDEFKNNLKKILEDILNYGVDKVIVVTPPRVVDEKWSVECQKLNNFDSHHHDQAVIDYVSSVVDLSNELGLKCVDLNGLMRESTDYTKLFYDGLHFSAEGGKLLFDSLSPIMEELFIKDNKLPTNFPSWNEVVNEPDVKDVPQFFDNQ
jgi:lysophospholipase L1-like esterase